MVVSCLRIPPFGVVLKFKETNPFPYLGTNPHAHAITNVTLGGQIVVPYQEIGHTFRPCMAVCLMSGTILGVHGLVHQKCQLLQRVPFRRQLQMEALTDQVASVLRFLMSRRPGNTMTSSKSNLLMAHPGPETPVRFVDQSFQ